MSGWLVSFAVAMANWQQFTGYAARSRNAHADLARRSGKPLSLFGCSFPKPMTNRSLRVMVLRYGLASELAYDYLAVKFGCGGAAAQT